jgi:hypothetical protein
MSQPELLRTVVGVLDAAGIEYMVTGSTASSLYGPPRSTHDIDLVVALKLSDVPQLLAAFPPPDFYLTRQTIVDAIQNQSMFNLLSLADGEKVDFWILTNEPFNRSRFSRRCVAESAGIRFHVSSPEDTILGKLHWSKLCGGSEKQFEDALRVYEVQAPTLDMNYLNEWAGRLGVEALWDRVKAEAKPF